MDSQPRGGHLLELLLLGRAVLLRPLEGAERTTRTRDRRSLEHGRAAADDFDFPVGS